MARRTKTTFTALRPLKRAADAVLGWITVAMLAVLRRINRQRMANVLGRLMRIAGPWLPEHKIGRANLAAAFPDKSPAEIEVILGGVWENLGRVAAEFAHIDRLIVGGPEVLRDPRGYDMYYDEASRERLAALRDDGRPGLVFAAHLANWELPAIAAHSFGLSTSVLYRRPNIGRASDAIIALRARCMGNMVAGGLDAPIRLGRALEGGAHVAMLVDQHINQGVDVVFFGRWVKANPLIAQLARLTNAPIHGARIVRLSGGNQFHGELTEEIAPVRDTAGNVDLQGTMQAITTVVEGWVRQHPEQWLWLHRRWR